MQLRNRVSLLIGGVCILLMCALVVVCLAVLRPSFVRLEDASARRDVGRVFDALASDARALSLKVSDWAAWDDTYKYMEDKNAAFESSNLNTATFNTMNTDLLCFLDNDNVVHWGQTRDEQSGSFAPLPAALLPELLKNPVMLRHDSLSSERYGVMVIGSEPWLIGARPITDSAFEAPRRGTLLVGRRITPARVAELSERTHIDISMAVAGPADKSSVGRSLFESSDVAIWFNDSQSVEIMPVTSATLSGRTVVADVFGNPALSMSVLLDRDITTRGEQTVRTLLIFGGATSVILYLLVLWMLDQWILSRLTLLQDEVTAIGQGVGLSKVTVRGSDELARLASHVNSMLTALDLARKGAEQASSAKSQFLANMSHEIRTPMTAILGYAEVLADSKTPQVERESASEILQRSGRHLLSLVNDILDISKIEAGKFEFEHVPCSPVQMVKDVHALMYAKAISKNLSFTLKVEGKVPATIQTDPTRLRQALINLVGNAVKFTSRGGVRVILSYSEETMRVTFKIKDDGIGLTPEQAEQLFQPFAQADASMTRRFGGTGLGLAITKHIAEKLGGAVEVQSLLSVGSTFSLSVSAGKDTPTQFVDGATAISAVYSLPQTGHEHVTIAGSVLLVEDGPDNQRLLGMYLKKAGAQVDVASNGQEGADLALARLREGKPFALVLMDMQMPVMDGYTATRLLRNMSYPGPILALTAHAMKAELDKCVEAGCDSFITKPVERSAFIREVSAWVADAEAARRLRINAQQNATLYPLPSTLTVLDTDHGKRDAA